MENKENYVEKKSFSIGTIIFIVILVMIISSFALKMGLENFLQTAINTSFDLLINTAFWIMAIAVLASAFSALLAEFGVFGLLNKIMSPITKLMYNLPGVSSLGAISAYFSDNPAVISLAKEEEFSKRFKPHQIPVLCNVGTSFGMGFIVTIAMATLAIPNGITHEELGGIAGGFLTATIIGLFASFIGSIVSVRLLNRASVKYFKEQDENYNPKEKIKNDNEKSVRKARPGSYFGRTLNALLDGGKSGVEIGMSIIPGVLVICTLVMMLTFGGTDAYLIDGVWVLASNIEFVSGGIEVGGEFINVTATNFTQLATEVDFNDNYYTGAAFQGIEFIPWLGNLPGIRHILELLFQFSDSGALMFPLTAVGSAGAAVGNVPTMLAEGVIGYREIAIFTAMGITWSGYLSTHASMMDALGHRDLTGKAIVAHTLGGLVSGIVACYLFIIINVFI